MNVRVLASPLSWAAPLPPPGVVSHCSDRRAGQRHTPPGQRGPCTTWIAGRLDTRDLRFPLPPPSLEHVTYLVVTANAADSTISTLRWNPDDGSGLELLATSPAGNGTSAFAIDRERNLVYATAKADSENEAPGIVTLALDRTTGELRPKARIDVEAPLAYLALAHGGTLLVGASYHGGFGAVWPVTPDGLGEPTGRVDHANVHCSYVFGDRVYFVSLGEDLVNQCRLGADGELEPLDPPTVAAPAGSGPRHLVVSGGNAYVVTEFSGEVIRYSIDESGRLTAAQSVSIVQPGSGLTHSRFGADPQAEHLIWGADVHVAHPGGGTDSGSGSGGSTGNETDTAATEEPAVWVLASERMTSTVASVPVTTQPAPADEPGAVPDRVTDNGDTAHLGEAAQFTPVEQQPRGFAVTPDGRYAVVVGEKSTVARAYRVEPDGALTEVASAKIGQGPNWVRIIPA